MKKLTLYLFAALMAINLQPVQATVGPPTAAGAIEVAFAQAARAHDVPADQLRAICYAETGSWPADERPALISRTGASGICQITARTAADRCPAGVDLLDLRQNIDCAARILRWQMTHYCGTDFTCNAGSYLCGPTGYRLRCYTNAVAWPGYIRRAGGYLQRYESALAARVTILAAAMNEPELALAMAGGAL